MSSAAAIEAGAARVAALSAPSKKRRVNMIFSSSWSFCLWFSNESAGFFTPCHVRIDSQYDDRARYDGLPFLRHRQHAQAVGQHRHDQRTDQRSKDRAAPRRTGDVPPITTAAMASSSYPRPNAGWAEFRRDAIRIPAMPQIAPASA